MKKCAQCGNDIPLNSANCTHCGYSSENINKNYKYGNTGKKQNKIGSNKIILFVILFLCFNPIGFIFILIFITQIENIFYPDLDYDVPPEVESEYIPEIKDCSSFCGVYEYNETESFCVCRNGSTYDKNGNLVSEGVYDMANIHLAPLNLIEWKNDINSGEPVVSVLCDNNYSCNSYFETAYDFALKEGYKFYFFDVDDLSNEDISYIAENYFSGNISPLYPITFIVKNSELIDSHSGIMYNDSLETFLRNSGVIYGK